MIMNGLLLAEEGGLIPDGPDFRRSVVRHDASEAFDSIQEKLNFTVPYRQLEAMERLGRGDITSGGTSWTDMIEDTRRSRILLGALTTTFGLVPRRLWHEALRVSFLPFVPQHSRLFAPHVWREVLAALHRGEKTDQQAALAAIVVFVDMWLGRGAIRQQLDFDFKGFLALARRVSHPLLAVALRIHSLAAEGSAVSRHPRLEYEEVQGFLPKSVRELLSSRQVRRAPRRRELAGVKVLSPDP
jgi:hypothetical protein